MLSINENNCEEFSFAHTLHLVSLVRFVLGVANLSGLISCCLRIKYLKGINQNIGDYKDKQLYEGSYKTIITNL